MNFPIRSNNSTYLFHLDTPDFKWSKVTEQSTPAVVTKSTTPVNPTEIPEDPSSSKAVISGVSVGLAAIVLTASVVCYRYIKGKQERGPSHQNSQGEFNEIGIQIQP
jgi:hypothetical protein